MNQIFIHKSKSGAPWAAILDREPSEPVQTKHKEIDELIPLVHYQKTSLRYNSRGEATNESIEGGIKQLNGKEVAISISHDGDYAVAVAMVAD
jgi:phosphopantetheinyl transferase (holo-ACP synthase)